MRLRFSFPRNFGTERQIRYARRTKMHDIIFFNFLSISDLFQPVRFLLLKSLKIFTVEKCCNYPLAITQGDRFASCENIVFRSQTSSLPPSPLLRSFNYKIASSCAHCKQNFFYKSKCCWTYRTVAPRRSKDFNENTLTFSHSTVRIKLKFL